MDRGTLSGAAEIGKALGKVSGKYKVDKHFVTTITDTSFTFARNQAAIDAEAALDGIYVLRTSVDPDTLDAAGVVAGYKNLANIERDFRIIKADDLDLRPIYHRLDQRARARADLPAGLLPRLAPTQAWAPLTFTDETPPARDNPVAPRNAPPPPTRKPRQNTTPTATRYAASAACSTISAPSPATASATTTPTSKSTNSPNPPPTNAAPSTSSTPPFPSPSPRSQNKHPPEPAKPQVNPRNHLTQQSQLRTSAVASR
ncbi:hypothetical protein MLAC_27620 [Mycobacterium lacus]|uniref:Transposase n=1 Tax=Mycobacterium lacus TaxID=169765 RepID=A0A7I7NM50_9MYCO|nr:hypothetical protein [Mycobacterium lacus]BBX97468.1 hypothetical protein MLAC_27620 [Mycobacterium lacus]